jgi:hypothetical protein
MILERCPWYVAGPIMGLLVIGLRALLNRGFGAVGGYVDIASHALTPRRMASASSGRPCAGRSVGASDDLSTLLSL